MSGWWPRPPRCMSRRSTRCPSASHVYAGISPRLGVGAGQETVTPHAATSARSSEAARMACPAVFQTDAALAVTAPESLRDQLRGLSLPHLVRVCALLRPGAVSTTTAASKLALRSLPLRYQGFCSELEMLDRELARLTREVAPALSDLTGVGPDVARPYRRHTEVASRTLSLVRAVGAPFRLANGSRSVAEVSSEHHDLNKGDTTHGNGR
jgi:hypothetical protein